MGTVGGRGFGGSVKFADGKTSSANLPHLNVWGFDISAAEFPQQTKTRVFGVNMPLGPLGPIQTKDARSFRRVLSVPEHSHLRAYSHQRRAFFSAAEILLRIYQSPIHLNGARWRTTFFRRRISRCLQNLVRQRVPFKCMGFWYIRSRISAAEKNARLWCE